MLVSCCKLEENTIPLKLAKKESSSASRRVGKNISVSVSERWCTTRGKIGKFNIVAITRYVLNELEFLTITYFSNEIGIEDY